VIGEAKGLQSTHRLAYAMGLALCVGTPSLIGLLLLSGVVPPGSQTPEGVYQQLGYLFTGVVFLSAAWVWWRNGQVLRGFVNLPEAERSPVVLREILLYSTIFEVSSFCGLVYWILVGSHAARHAWGFILLTPTLFLVLVPRYDRWSKALEG
jgi:hypothetical protein